jgi:hypothetical protein
MKDDGSCQIRIDNILFASKNDFDFFTNTLLRLFNKHIAYINGKKNNNIESENKLSVLGLYSLEQRRCFQALKISVDYNEENMKMSIKGTGTSIKIYAIKTLIAELYEKESIISYYAWPSYEGDDDKIYDKTWTLEQHERERKYQNQKTEQQNVKVRSFIKSNAN